MPPIDSWESTVGNRQLGIDPLGFIFSVAILKFSVAILKFSVAILKCIRRAKTGRSTTPLSQITLNCYLENTYATTGSRPNRPRGRTLLKNWGAGL